MKSIYKHRICHHSKWSLAVKQLAELLTKLDGNRKPDSLHHLAPYLADRLPHFLTIGMPQMKVINVKDSIAFKTDKLNKVSLFDTDKFFCDVYCFEPGHSQKVHSHDGSDKIYYVLEGKGKVTVGSEEKELSENEITLAPAGQDHGVVNHTEQKLVMLVFMAPKP